MSPSAPLLGTLKYNGGFAPTMMPAANSPAINAGANCEDHDERGIVRSQGPACDIGAVERRSVEDYLFNNAFEFQGGAVLPRLRSPTSRRLRPFVCWSIARRRTPISGLATNFNSSALIPC